MINASEGGKYRTPDLSEFADRFVFEVYSEGYWEDSIEDYCGWYQYTLGGNNWRDSDEIAAELGKGNIRVENSNGMVSENPGKTLAE